MRIYIVRIYIYTYYEYKNILETYQTFLLNFKEEKISSLPFLKNSFCESFIIRLFFSDIEYILFNNDTFYIVLSIEEIIYFFFLLCYVVPVKTYACLNIGNTTLFTADCFYRFFHLLYMNFSDVSFVTQKCFWLFSFPEIFLTIRKREKMKFNVFTSIVNLDKYGNLI